LHRQIKAFVICFFENLLKKDRSYMRLFLSLLMAVSLSWAWAGPWGQAKTVSGTLTESTAWSLADSPIEITDDVTIPEGLVLQIEPGVEIQLSEDTIITVDGRLDALGTAEQPIAFIPSGSQRWGGLSYDTGGTGTLRHCLFHRGSHAEGSRIGVVNIYRNTAPVIIDSCTFTAWPDDFNAKAIQGYHSTQTEIRHCYFGEGANECVHGVDFPALLEYNTFARRSGYSDSVDIGETKNPGPVIRYNIFLGSDDDAIDLDDCDAYVEGNLVMDCYGGSHDPIGISGDRDSLPVIVNNVIINCENGIGFKNGANITVLNNTIINCDKGIWLHQSATHAVVKNTIIWGRDDQVSIRLEPGSTIDISYSIIKGNELYPGENNMNANPLFVDIGNRDLHLQPGSPAIDAGWHGEPVLLHDFDRTERINATMIPDTTLPYPSIIDIGAYEFVPEITKIRKWYEFE
jgi:parallel beta-helix repeat protein